jgi:hypothetical protein
VPKLGAWAELIIENKKEKKTIKEWGKFFIIIEFKKWDSLNAKVKTTATSMLIQHYDRLVWFTHHQSNLLIIKKERKTGTLFFKINI